jgi:hypothetical protein
MFINEELEKKQNSLLYDHAALSIYARQLGYGQENDRIIRIVELEGRKNTPVSTGNIYFVKMPDFITDRFIKLTAIFAGLAVFILLCFVELINKKVH